MKEKEFYFEFSYTDLFQYAAMLAEKLGVPCTGNEVVYPPEIAEGSCKFFKINEYMSFQVVHYTARQKMIFKRLPALNSHITVTFQDFTFAKCSQHNYNCNEIILNNNSLGSIQCKSTRLQETVVIEPCLEVKVILVLMKENWVENVLHDSVSKDKFIRYLVNQDANLRKEFLRNFFRQYIYPAGKPVPGWPGTEPAGKFFKRCAHKRRCRKQFPGSQS
jgi:hypothetical protein